MDYIYIYICVQLSLQFLYCSTSSYWILYSIVPLPAVEELYTVSPLTELSTAEVKNHFQYDHLALLWQVIVRGNFLKLFPLPQACQLCRSEQTKWTACTLPICTGLSQQNMVWPFLPPSCPPPPHCTSFPPTRLRIPPLLFTFPPSLYRPTCSLSCGQAQEKMHDQNPTCGLFLTSGRWKIHTVLFTNMHVIIGKLN
jgi:hypothetical protein